jgi:hypothetical protein
MRSATDELSLKRSAWGFTSWSLKCGCWDGGFLVLDSACRSGLACRKCGPRIWDPVDSPAASVLVCARRWVCHSGGLAVFWPNGVVLHRRWYGVFARTCTGEGVDADARVISAGYRPLLPPCAA